MPDDKWICSRCRKQVDQGRTHYVDGLKPLHVRCMNEIEASFGNRESGVYVGDKKVVDFEDLFPNFKEETKTFADAVILACLAHEDQVDKGGSPYIEHPLRVSKQMRTSEERIVAMLHDVIEDSDVSLQYLRDEGYSDVVVDAIDALTRREGETYMNFIKRAKQNQIARKVKIADIKDNMDLSRIPNPTEKDMQRMKRYEKALKELETE